MFSIILFLKGNPWLMAVIHREVELSARHFLPGRQFLPGGRIV
jgi:hypothetical protein